jgi:hypothetical protein
VVYQSIEEIMWRTLQSAISGQIEIAQALGQISERTAALIETEPVL